MRASFVLSLQTLASQAESDCSKLCDFVWWRTATTADVQAELGSGAIVKGQNEYGSTPLVRPLGAAVLQASKFYWTAAWMQKLQAEMGMYLRTVLNLAKI